MAFVSYLLTFLSWVFSQNFYKDNRDYGNLLDGEELEDEEFEEDDGDGGGVPAHHAEEEDFSQECQDYLRRRERLKELARQELRKARENGRGSTTSTKKPLPFDKYVLSLCHRQKCNMVKATSLFLHDSFTYIMWFYRCVYV